MTIREFEAKFPDETAARAYLVSMRWPEGVRCPRCQSGKVHKIGRRWAFQCKQCTKKGYQFSPLVGTIFENTNLPLRTWFHVIFLMCQSKKGVSALQIHRMIGTGSYRSAWYMCHRIRAAMQSPEFKRLSGIVEVDETYVGGSLKNMHRSRARKLRTEPRLGKTAVIGAIERKGNVVAKVIRNTSGGTLTSFVRRTVDERVDLLASDQAAGYRFLKHAGYPHKTVDHSKGEYVRGVVHTANLDSFWSLLKRGIVGNFHHVSKGYLPLYLNEFSYRHNNRNNPEMFSAIIAGA